MQSQPGRKDVYLQQGPVLEEGVQPDPSFQLKFPCLPNPETCQKGTRYDKIKQVTVSISASHPMG